MVFAERHKYAGDRMLPTRSNRDNMQLTNYSSITICLFQRFVEALQAAPMLQAVGKEQRDKPKRGRKRKAV